MKKILLILPIIFVGLTSLAYSQTQKIGYIDLQIVIKDSKAGKAAKVSFEKAFQSKRAIIEQKRKALENLRQDFIKNGAVMSETKRKTMADSIEKKQKDLDRTREDFRLELQKKDLELTQKILKDIEGIVKQIGDSEGFSLILEKSEGGLLYGGKDADITGKVISAYDSK
ncbi:MAG: hypothetical protein GTO02_08045 [Candidatus Dadabacteria bacterium]|nr:hypothetical protein [Candidatus Dadabacteria bacterium]NIQ14345.1 hypothetical protein [Candidatus Dadabacteria bacterium]